MTILKKATKRMLWALGYELSCSSEPRVEFEIFCNLARAYEQHLNESANLILPNETRLKLLARLMGTPPSKAYFTVQALAKCTDTSGDVCEFGVAQGATSALIANEIAPYADRILHLFDSFEGLPKPSGKRQTER